MVLVSLLFIGGEVEHESVVKLSPVVCFEELTHDNGGGILVRRGWVYSQVEGNKTFLRPRPPDCLSSISELLRVRQPLRLCLSYGARVNELYQSAFPQLLEDVQGVTECHCAESLFYILLFTLEHEGPEAVANEVEVLLHLDSVVLLKLPPVSLTLRPVVSDRLNLCHTLQSLKLRQQAFRALPVLCTQHQLGPLLR